MPIDRISVPFSLGFTYHPGDTANFRSYHLQSTEKLSFCFAYLHSIVHMLFTRHVFEFHEVLSCFPLGESSALRLPARVAARLPRIRAKEGEISCTGLQCVHCMCDRHTKPYTHMCGGLDEPVQPCRIPNTRGPLHFSFPTPEEQL